MWRDGAGVTDEAHKRDDDGDDGNRTSSVFINSWRRCSSDTRPSHNDNNNYYKQ